MAFIDIEGTGYKPAGTKTSGYTTPAAGPTPIKASTVQQPVPQKASVVQQDRDDRLQWFDDGSGGAYRDPLNGNVWKGGVWYNPQGEVWNEGRGWEAPESYNTFVDQLNRQNTADANYFGFNDSQYQPGVTTPKISAQDFTNIQRARELLDSQTYNLRGPGFDANSVINNASTMYRPEVMAAYREHEALTPQFSDISEAQRSIPGVTPQEAKQLSDTDLYAQAGQAARFGDRWGDINTGKSSLSELFGPIAQGYNKATTVMDAFAETGAQLTPAALTATKAIPGLGAIVNTGANLMGYRPQDSALSGIQDLGSSIAQSDDPWDFAKTQQAKLQERPMGEQLASQVLFDPTNLVGAGLTTKALRAAGDAGTFSSLFRGAAAVNDAIDSGTRAAVGAVAKPLAPLARPISSEAGSIPAGLAARAGVGAAAGTAGYMTADDDASKRDRLLRALGFGVGGALGADAIRIGSRGAASSYGKIIEPLAKARQIPFFQESGFMRKAWLDALPENMKLEGADIRPLVYLKQADDSIPMPPRTKISNKLWEVLAAAQNNHAKARVIEPRVYGIAVADLEAKKELPAAIDAAIGDVATRYRAVNQFSEEGYLLRSDGSPIQVIDETGTPLFKDEKPIFAGPRDVEENWQTYLARGDITQEQAGIIQEFMEAVDEIKQLRALFGLPLDESKYIGPDGYLPRGKHEHVLADKTPALKTGQRVVEGKRPGASRERTIRYQGEHIAQGWRYEDPVEAIRRFMTEAYEEVITANTRDNLSKLAFDITMLDESGEQVVKNIQLGQLLKEPGIQQGLKEQITAIRETRAELRKLNIRKGRIDRDIRLNSRWTDTNRRRAERLVALATDQGMSAAIREDAANDALQLSKIAIDDALTAARSYAKQTMIEGVRASEARKQLDSVLEQASALSKRIDAGEDAIKAGEIADLQQKVAESWGYAEAIRAAMAEDIVNADRLISALPYEDALAAHTQARNALQDAKTQFSTSLGELQKMQKRAQLMAAREATAAANVRSLVNQGKADEIRKIVERKSEQISRLTGQSEELGERINALNEILVGQRELKTILKDDLQQAIDLGKEFKALFPTGGLDQVEGFKGIHLPPEVANTIKRYVVQDTGERGNLAAFYDLGNDLFRFLGAALDASRSATVGLAGFADNPEKWKKGLQAGLAAAKDQEQAFHIMREMELEAVDEGLPSIAEAIGRYKLQVASAEHLRLGMATEGSLLDTMARKPGFRHADALYSTPSNIERIAHFYDELRVRKAKGLDWKSDPVRAAVANAANVLTGRAATGFLSPLIGDAGSRRLLFAGRFVQSTIESVYNAMFVSGIEGDVARRSMLRVAAGGAGLTFAINELLGNKTDWRPVVDGRTNPNFMRIRVLGQDISLFGPWDSLMKGVLATAMGDPGYFLRTKFAPGAGMVYDATILQFKDAMGQDMFSPQGLWNLAPLPFGMKDVIERAGDTDYRDPEQIGSLALGASAALLGVKASPMTPRERYEAILQEKHKDYAPTRPDGSPLNYPMPENPYDDPLFTLEYGTKHPDEVPKPVSDLGAQMKDIRDRFDKTFQALTDDFESGEINLGEWKSGRTTLKDQERALLEPLINQIDFSDPKEGTPAWWLKKYYDTFERATDSETEQLNRDDLDFYQSEILKEAKDAGVDTWLFDYIDTLTASKAAHPIEREYLEAVQQLSRDGYFMGRENSKPRFIGLTMADEDVYEARRIVDGKANDPKYKGLSHSQKTALILRDEGYSLEQVTNVINSNKDDYQHPAFKVYKLKNPHLVQWLNEKNFYSTLQAITGK